MKRESSNVMERGQENTKARLLEAFAEKKSKLKNEMPKFLWDQI